MLTVVAMGSIPWHFLQWTDHLTLAPGVVPADDTVKAEKNAIKAAMINAIEISNPGDVIAQEDITFTRDPFESPLQAGTITMLTESKNPRHWCPRAFRFATEEDGAAIIQSWQDEPLQCCYGWQAIPKTLYLAGRHHVDHH
jgi:hypothetical protein